VTSAHSAAIVGEVGISLTALRIASLVVITSAHVVAAVEVVVVVAARFWRPLAEAVRPAVVAWAAARPAELAVSAAASAIRSAVEKEQACAAFIPVSSIFLQALKLSVQDRTCRVTFLLSSKMSQFGDLVERGLE
jgi:hypothetical protein